MPTRLGVFSIIAAQPSFDEATSIASETKLLNCLAMAYASSIVVACCKMWRASSDIGIAEVRGIAPSMALRVMVSPCSFIPDTTPIMPGHDSETKR